MTGMPTVPLSGLLVARDHGSESERYSVSDVGITRRQAAAVDFRTSGDRFWRFN